MAIEYRSKKHVMSKIISSVLTLRNKINILSKMTAFKKMNLKPFVKASNFTQAAEILKKVSKKISIKLSLKALNMPIKSFSNIIYRIYLRKLEVSFS
jgi:hypothetical protein